MWPMLHAGRLLAKITLTLVDFDTPACYYFYILICLSLGQVSFSLYFVFACLSMWPFCRC